MGKIDLSDPRTPTWPQLKLDRPMKLLYYSLGVYFVTLAMFWLAVAKVIELLGSVFNPFAYLALANYLLLVGLCYWIQKVLHDSGLGRHGVWQVVVGALLLNPCALGWWIPISVLLSAHKMRRALRERWREAADA
jgi:apolipoprotein N-acyltransferase